MKSLSKIGSYDHIVNKNMHLCILKRDVSYVGTSQAKKYFNLKFANVFISSQCSNFKSTSHHSLQSYIYLHIYIFLHFVFWFSFLLFWLPLAIYFLFMLWGVHFHSALIKLRNKIANESLSFI